MAKLMDFKGKVENPELIESEDKLNLESCILNTKKALVVAEKKKAEILSKTVVSWQSLSEIDDEILALKAGEERLSGYLKTYFDV